MPEIVVKVPEMDEETLKRLTTEAERAVFEELRREEMLELSNELLSKSELSKEEAIELGRRVKKGRYKELKEKGVV